MTWEEIVEAREAWLGKRSRKCKWPREGVAIEGDFAGIQGYVFKPVPGARGAAKRLRGRSLQVSAITALVAERVRELAKGEIFYSAGGRFLVFGRSGAEWKTPLAELQIELDNWMGKQFRGEVVFHLAGAEFDDGKIPREELGAQMAERRMRALDYFLRDGHGWVEAHFERGPGAQAFRCDACLTTANVRKPQVDEEDAEICDECDRDKRLGGKLATCRHAMLLASANGEVPFLDQCYTISDTGLEAGVIHHVPRHTPREGREPLTLEEVSEKCRGSRKWLAYLRLDADGVGQAFRDLKDDPMRVQALSNLLHGFFSDWVQHMLTGPKHKYYWLYPVYGGGDDLFLIGPWDLVIDFAANLEREFHKATSGTLSFSAGISLSKPKQHILTKAEEAEIGLNDYAKKKTGKASVHVLGETFRWDEFHGVLQTAQKVAEWYDQGLIPSQMLQSLMGLRRQSAEAERKGEQAKAVRFRPMLHYQARRNLTRAEQGPVLAWIEKLISRNTPGADATWRAMGFVARYAMLARKEKLLE